MRRRSSPSTWGPRSLTRPPTADPSHVPVRRRLDLTATPPEVLRRLRGRDRLVALLGAWHQGEALIACEPVRLLETWDDVDLPRLDADGFGGGWIGAWGYRLGSQVEHLPEGPPRPMPQPDHRAGFYDLVLRRVRGTWWLESIGDPDPARIEELIATVSAPTVAAPFNVGRFDMTPSPQAHRDAISRALGHIAAGDIFQVNLCARLEATFEGDPLDAFCAGVERLKPAYAAYVSSPEGALASFSPELFLRRTGDEVLTSPIKGTAALSTDPRELEASAKNRAENVMIVDLMRNDLGRVAVPGSVRVPALNRVERHSVWHLVSDVVAHLPAGTTDRDLLRATFPPGSVTGAPKVRAMELIAELEATGREAYTGAIGHVSAAAGLEMNVVIRTFEFATAPDGTTRVWLGVGGGIVADSDPAGEYAECLDKARPLIDAIGGRLDLVAPPAPAATATEPEPSPSGPVDVHLGVFETVLVLDGRAVDLDAHLARLDASVRAVHGTTVRAGLEEAVHARVAGLIGPHRLRIDAAPQGGDVGISMATAPLTPTEPAWSLVARVVPGGLGPHKWADRARIPVVPGHEPLVTDTDGSVLETARANLFAVLDDGLHTPALDGRLLPGTARARVIELASALGLPVFQHRMTTADLATATEVFATNALRGIVPVTSCEGVGRWTPGPVTARLASALEHRETAPRAPARSTDPSATARVLFIDNYDSFVFNLVQYVGELGGRTEVVRNDEVGVDDLLAGDFTHVVVSPGPGTPADAGISAEVVRRFGPHTPVLGVCLGHQVIAEVHGATVVRAEQVVHGKSSLVHHDGLGVFADLPSPLTCARYHSLVVQDVREPLTVTARTGSGIVMGVRHRDLPVEGVQIHPESILTSHGHDLLATFLRRHPAPGVV
ncbi:aminodeoxychorismate synthase component I [Aeromicrobium sp. 636]|uniref:Aminodeoxychorismate synthase component I n=1 Tax=Aeromicrobium senzhongii TaxID=2663859 RepID=A0A8I0EX98_9ACTN|nr:aminodeoxychorismate synthase component I [Aeromicrobium senzhongii]MBC9227068.1 aminodeoxychorismate synthase component I [Aeromicrobium senzhongii]MCQ3999168.1 aminodeoxychorismate synthase component I [Aeromicrobium sp. 636]